MQFSYFVYQILVVSKEANSKRYFVNLGRRQCHCFAKPRFLIHKFPCVRLLYLFSIRIAFSLLFCHEELPFMTNILPYDNFWKNLMLLFTSFSSSETEKVSYLVNYWILLFLYIFFFYPCDRAFELHHSHQNPKLIGMLHSEWKYVQVDSWA